MSDPVEQTITYNLGLGGVDQKTDDKFAPLGRPRELANVRFPKTSMVAKRNGFAPATTDTADNITLQRLLPIANGMLAVGKTAAGARVWYSLVADSTGDPRKSTLTTRSGVIGSLGPVACVPPVPKAWVDNIISGISGIYSADCAVGLSQTCYLYASTDTFAPASGWVIVDNATGAQVNNGSLAAGGIAADRQCVFAVPNSNAFVTCSTDSDSNTITVRLITSAGVLATQFTIVINASHVWDVALFGSTLVFAYVVNAATTMKVSTVVVSTSSLGAAASSGAITMTVAPLKIAVCTPYSSSEDAVIVAHDATNGNRGITVGVLSLTVVQALWAITNFATTGTANQLAGVRLASGEVFLLHEKNNASDYAIGVRSSTFAVGAAVAAPTVAARNVYLCSRPLLTSGSATPFFLTGHRSKTGSGAGLQPSLFLWEGVNVVARFLHDDADLPPTARSVTFLPSICAVPAASGATSTEYVCAAPRVRQTIADENGSSTIRNIAAMRFSVDAKSGYMAVEDGSSLLIQGGYLALFDGVDVCENGFLLYPEIISLTASNAGGALPNNGTFDFVVVFTQLDSSGDLHRSAPSEVLTGTTGAADNTISLVLRGLTPSAKQSYGVEIYRTENNGATFYLAENEVVSIPGAFDTTTYTISGSDTTLIASTPLGQQDGILDNEQPSCPIAIKTTGKRILVTSGNDRLSVVEGKQRVKGEGAAFFDGVSRRVTPEGEIFALSSLGERSVAWKKRRIFIASGDGADDSDSNDTLTEFEAHPIAGVGCAYPRSIVETSQGVVFKSEKGYYLLDLGGGIQPLGVGIDDYKDFPITSAAFHADRNEVHFLLNDGPRLVLSLHETEQGTGARWSIDESIDNREAATQIIFEAFGDIAIVNGLMYLAVERRSTTGSPSSLVVEDVGGYADRGFDRNNVGPPVSMRITTSWIPLTGQQQGRGRLRWAKFLGNVKSVHTARVRAAYDYVEDWVDDKSITSAAATNQGASAEQWEFRPSKQRHTAVKFEFTEVLASAGQGLELNQILLRVASESDAKKSRRSQRMTAT